MTPDSLIVQAGDRDERRDAQRDPRADLDHGPTCTCRDCALDQIAPEDFR